MTDPSDVRRAADKCAEELCTRFTVLTGLGICRAEKINRVASIIAAEFAGMAETLAKLPRTADGVPIVPGMTVYLAWHNVPLGCRVFAINDCADSQGKLDVRYGWEDLPGDPAEYYSTREAASRALAADGADGKETP